MPGKYYLKTAQAILEDFILSGKVKPGEKLSSVREFELHYSVGRSAIWHALNVLEEQGYISKRASSGCYVSKIHRNETPMDKVIGFVGCSNDKSLCSEIQMGVESICGKYGHQILFGNNRLSYTIEKTQIERMIQNGCLGIVLYPLARTRTQLQNDYLKTQFKDIPIVLVDIAYPEQGRARVVFDNYQACYDVTKVLINECHKRIACVRVSDDFMQKSCHDRYQGYRDAIAEAKFQELPLELSVPCSHAEEFVQLEGFIQRWNDSNPEDRPTVIIALHDTQALKLTGIAENLGIRIPEDLTIAGFDADPNVRMRHSYITTAPDFFYAGKVAARILLEEIRTGKRSNDTYILQVPVKNRGLNSFRRNRSYDIYSPQSEDHK